MNNYLSYFLDGGKNYTIINPVKNNINTFLTLLHELRLRLSKNFKKILPNNTTIPSSAVTYNGDNTVATINGNRVRKSGSSVHYTDGPDKYYINYYTPQQGF